MKSTDRKPNILFVVIEQQKASAAGCYGNPFVPTPVLNGLASNGILFENAFSCSSICTPARCSFLTGVHPLVHQCTCHQNRAPFNMPLLPEVLAGAGYFTGVIGHYERQRNLGRGFHEMVDFQDYLLRPAYTQRYGMGKKGVGYSAGSIPCDPEEGLSHLMTDRSIQMIDDAVGSDAPFFLHVCYEDAHAPYFAAPPFDSMVEQGALPVPPKGTDRGRPEWHSAVFEESNGDEATVEDIQRAVAMYYGMIACADSNLGRLHAALDKRKLLEDTWIIVVSDHGDYTGEKGLYAKSESLYECLLHVPLVIVPPRGAVAPREVRIPWLVETLDLFATILGIANVDFPRPTQSYDLLERLRSEPAVPIREQVFAAVGDYHGKLGNSLPAGIPEAGRHPGLLRSVRSTEGVYIRDPDYGDEAYDNRSDPLELENVANSGGKWIDPLRRELDLFEESCLKLRNDLGVVPGPRGFEEGWE